MSLEASTLAPVRIGISACLLGQHVRYDGGHKRDAWLVDVLGRYARWVPVCPEMEMGLGVPRDPMRLEWRDGELRMVTPKTGADHTDRLRTFAEKRLAGLAEEGLCGYVFKKDSPCCVIERVRLYSGDDILNRCVTAFGRVCIQTARSR